MVGSLFLRKKSEKAKPPKICISFDGSMPIAQIWKVPNNPRYPLPTARCWGSNVLLIFLYSHYLSFIILLYTIRFFYVFTIKVFFFSFLTNKSFICHNLIWLILTQVYLVILNSEVTIFSFNQIFFKYFLGVLSQFTSISCVQIKKCEFLLSFCFVIVYWSKKMLSVTIIFFYSNTRIFFSL